MATMTQFSEKEIDLVQSAAMRVWEECAYDVLQMVAEEKGQDVERVSIPRAEVIELALDAGRAEEKLKRMLKEWPDEQRAEFLARWEALDYAAKIRLVKPAFPYARWGV